MGQVRVRATPAAPDTLTRECWLVPFAAPPQPRTLRSRVRLANGRLTVRYVLEGALEDLELPRPVDPPRRLDGLWQATCFEAFLSSPPAAGYRELNLAPAGHWACYRFSAPREGLQLEPALAALDWKTHRVPGHFAIRFTLRTAELELGGPALRLGLSAILMRRDGVREFWALDHPAAAPDFHNPAGHLLELPL